MDLKRNAHFWPKLWKFCLGVLTRPTDQLIIIILSVLQRECQWLNDWLMVEGQKSEEPETPFSRKINFKLRFPTTHNMHWKRQDKTSQIKGDGVVGGGGCHQTGDADRSRVQSRPHFRSAPAPDVKVEVFLFTCSVSLKKKQKFRWFHQGLVKHCSKIKKSLILG